MKSMNEGPPHVEAKVGPAEALSGQLQLIYTQNGESQCLQLVIANSKVALLRDHARHKIL